MYVCIHTHTNTHTHTHTICIYTHTHTHIHKYEHIRDTFDIKPYAEASVVIYIYIASACLTNKLEKKKQEPTLESSLPISLSKRTADNQQRGEKKGT